MRKTLLALAGPLLLAACAGPRGDATPATPVAPALGCDAALAAAYTPEPGTRVLRVQAFRQGQEVRLENSPAVSAANPAVTAPVDLCLVKLLVGPGKPGAADAPSTSAGIGIEVWLPAQWNRVLRVHGSGGWAGGFHSDARAIGLTGGAEAWLLAEVASGYVVSTSDHGHASPLSTRDASFAMNEDGSINTVGWRDFSERSLHEMAVHTKAFARRYYGQPHRWAYWDGYSTGGRQGLKLAQKYPTDFDGILAGAPANHWTRFITAELYPQVVMQREFGAPIALAKLNAVNAAATAACGGAALGFLLDPRDCRYDPARDAAVLCPTEQIGGRAGTGPAATCVTLREARAINRLWYGMTRDGTAPEPQADAGMALQLDLQQRLWWGLPRGTVMDVLGGPQPFPIASAQVALQLQNPRIAQTGPFLKNATGTGADGWKQLDFAGLASAYDRGLALQPQFADINTDQADLSAFRAAGGKLLTYHGWADEFIMAPGSLNYHARAAAAAGGEAALHGFYRLFMIPGLAHDGRFTRSGAADPATLTRTDGAKVPLPQDGRGRDELFLALRRWVEQGQAPERIEVMSRNGQVSLPLCVHPARATHDGRGPVTQAASYACR